MLEDEFVLAEDTMETWAGETKWILCTAKKGSNKHLEFLEIHSITLQKVGPAILKEENGVSSISLDKHLTITLCKLGRGDYNYAVGEMTGYVESTVSCLIKEVWQEIVKILWEESVTKLFPKREEDFRQALIDMESECQFKCAFAAIVDSHLSIKCPSLGPEAMKQYHNFLNYLAQLMPNIDLNGLH